MKKYRKRSLGHLAWVTNEHGVTFEVFERDGELFTATLRSAVMPDGYRCGQFSCYSHARVEYFAMLKRINCNVKRSHLAIQPAGV